MRLVILAVGQARGTPEGTLSDDYCNRARAMGKRLGFSSVTVEEVGVSKLREARARIAEEGERLAARIPDAAHVILLDAKGNGMTSDGFAEMLGALRDAGARDLVFLLRGAGRVGSAGQRQAGTKPRLRAADLAASAGASHAGRADLSRADHSRRPSPSPRLRPLSGARRLRRACQAEAGRSPCAG